MAPNEQLKELPTIETKCLEILKTFGYKGGNYSIKVSFGTFSISLENGDRIPEPLPVRRRKKPSTIKRDKNRRIEFLKNKNSTSSCPSSSGVNTLEAARVLDHQPSVTLPTDENPQTNVEQQERPCSEPESECVSVGLCVCGSVPCVCPISQPPIVPKLKLKKASGTWSSMHHCPNCNKALHDQHHQCGDVDGEDGDDISGPQLLDLPACEEISNSLTLTADQKYTMLFDNCVKLIKVEPINHVVAKFCFSHAKFYQLRRDDLTLGFSKEHLIKEILDPEYERLKSENELA